MADDSADISGMPDPGTIGLSPAAQVDPADSMPAPEDLFRKYRGIEPGVPVAPGEVEEFMKNPPDPNWKPPTLKGAASQLTGLPRAAASYAAAVPAGVASIAGQGVGALGAAFDPANAAEHLSQGRDYGRDWASKVNKLADYVPATDRGAQFAQDLASLPGGVIKETADSTLGKVLPDNAYQAVSDVAQDIGNDLPALGAPAAIRSAVKGVKAATRAAKSAAASEAATATAPNADALPPDMKPPVGEPVSGDMLRSQPNPIPAPEGTAHRASAEAAVEAAEPSAPAESPTSAPEPSAQAAAPAAPTLPESDTARQDMNLSPEQRAIVREGVAARRRASDNEPDAVQSPGDTQRGSVRLFNPPSKEGPQETPTPAQQSVRQGHLDALDRLSGGQLPTRRTSALTGDYNATGDDFQMKEVGNQQMRQQIASENNALHAATENVHNSIGSEFNNSVDSTTLGDRGRVARGAIQAIEKHFDDATDAMYNVAREQNKGKQIPALQRVKAYLDDDSNFTNDAEIGLQRAAKQRLERLWSTGDPDKGTPPGSVNAAERFREFLNEKGKNPQAMGVAKDLKNHTDMDVAEQGGPGLFEAARAMRRHSYQMLEEPNGIKKLLTPGDSQGINHAIPEHKVMDYIADLPRDQHGHVLNVLRAGAHLGEGELAERSASAIKEIQAHAISRIHAAATNADGTWNARKFYAAADRYARNAPETFKERPDVLSNLTTINDAGNTLHMDKHYPGAAAQSERTGAVGHIVGAVGHTVSNLAHEVPFGGRMVGRALEKVTDKVTGNVNEAARDKAVAQRLVDRTGKQRGSVQVIPEKNENIPGVEYAADGRSHVATTSNGETRTRLDGSGNLRVISTHTEPEARGSGEGTARLERLAQEAHKLGGKLVSDAEVSAPEQNVYKALAYRGYDVKMNPHTTDPGTGVQKSVSELKGVYEVGPRPPVKGAPSQRGSVQLFNDNKLNRAADESRDRQRGAGIEPRNERNERVANQQMGGRKPLSADQEDIIRRLGGSQRGSARVEKRAEKEKE